MKTNILDVKLVKKEFNTDSKAVEILKGITFSIEKGEFVAIIGSSGSGKSTLLSIIAGLDDPSSGSVSIDNQNLSTLSEDELSELRNKKIGFIFQSFFLVPSLTAYENILLPQQIAKKEDTKYIESLIKSVGMEHRKENYPIQLSGGEKQRIAIARALVNKPEILFADEPTGNLDSKNSKQIIELLQELHEKEKKTIIVVTHDQNIAKVAKRIIEVSDGKIISDTHNGHKKKVSSVKQK
jgi:putative ABC transport system ATP-binding protein